MFLSPIFPQPSPLRRSSFPENFRGMTADSRSTAPAANTLQSIIHAPIIHTLGQNVHQNYRWTIYRQMRLLPVVAALLRSVDFSVSQHAGMSG